VTGEASLALHETANLESVALEWEQAMAGRGGEESTLRVAVVCGELNVSP
jgi:hypothetical protein